MNEVEVEVIVKYNDDADYIRVKNGTYVQDLVRCKNCKYGEIDNEDFPTQYLCHHHGSSWNERDHFCSYGERADA